MSKCITCQEPPDCGCDDVLDGYSLVGPSYENSQKSFLVPCPPGFTCGPDWPKLVPVIIHWNPPPPPVCPNSDCGGGGGPPGVTLRLPCCETPVTRVAAYGISQTAYNALVNEMLNECAAQEAKCKSTPELPPPATAKNDQQCVACDDGATMAQTASLPTGLSIQANSLCVAAGIFAATSKIFNGVTYPTTKAAANARALAFVTSSLATLITSGVIECLTPSGDCSGDFSYIPPDCPCDLGVADNTVVGTATPTLPASNDVSFVFGAGSYSITYLSGAISVVINCGFDSNDYDGYYIESDPFGVAAGNGYWAITINSVGGTSLGALLDNGGGYGSYGFISDLSGAPVGCAPISLATFEADVQSDPGQPAFVDHFGGTFKIHYQAVAPLAGGGSPPNPSFEIRRIKKDCIAPVSRLRISAGSFAELLPILVSELSPVGGAVNWDGTMPNFDRVALFDSWEWDVDFSGGALKVNGKQIAPSTRVYHSTAAQPTATGCAWICGILFSDFALPWVGYGGNGCEGEGTYVFSETLNGWTLTGRLTDVAAATAAPLPANTLTAGVLTASANGSIPAIDAVPLVNGDRILVKDEVSGASNGIYDVTDVGSAGTPWILTRSADQDTSPEVLQGVFTRATAGDSNLACYFRMVTAAVTLDTTPLVWLKIPAQITVESY